MTNVATYDEWNQALLSYIVTGLPRGASVFLHVDDDVLQQVAQANVVPDAASGEPAVIERDDAVNDFCWAVRDRVLDGAGSISLASVQGIGAHDTPHMLAFLAAMVLAATRMADEEEISQNNYFKRLREVLRLPAGEGRPPGLETPGSEEPLWQEWARWLQHHDHLPTARHGEGGMRYINYPISQALLRRADKDRLHRLYAEKRWTREWDAETLMARVRQESSSLPQHLRHMLLTASDSQRLQGLGEAIFEEYEAWREDPFSPTSRGLGSRPSHLLAGLYRTEDPFTAEVSYYLYPRQRRRYAGSVVVRYDNAPHALTTDRPGWYQPCVALEPGQLTAGVHLPIEQPTELRQLVLPQRDFWILVPDPENADSGVYASWGPPPLGSQFLLLCKKRLLSQVEHLRSERLINWTGAAIPLGGSDEWVEIHHCAVVSQVWSGVFIDDNALFDALQPRAALDISLTDGLRVPRAAGWLEDHGPQVTVAAFAPMVELRVVSVADDRDIMADTVRANTSIAVQWPGPGDYRVEASSNREMSSRLVRIVAWLDLRVTPQGEGGEAIGLGLMRLRGALLEPATVGGD
jgi:hypothetical protein